ncbi:MAG: glycosyltransferase [Caldilineales bacterium]
MTRRILFLISDTGGGHRASAEALAEALQRLHGAGVACDIVDPFVEYAHWPLNRAPDAYLPLVNRYGWLWQALWRLGEHPASWRAARDATAAWQAQRMHRLFAEHPADLVVSVHPLLSQAPQRTLRAGQASTRLATVVTDLSTAPRMWYDRTVDLLVAPCDEVASAARAAGVPAARVRQLGLPIRLAFAETQVTRAGARAQLGLADLPTVLVMGGGEGMGPLETTVNALAAAVRHQPAQIVVICGRNAALQERLTGRSWPVPVTALGFTPRVPLWMRAADCLVTKAGPGAIAEALACELPMVLSSFIPGQETGNVGYVEQNGVGVYRASPAAIAATVHGWLASPETTAAIRARERSLARPYAALDIARALSDLL